MVIEMIPLMTCLFLELDEAPSDMYVGPRIFHYKGLTLLDSFHLVSYV
jgi:hypothetical protein